MTMLLLRFSEHSQTEVAFTGGELRDDAESKEMV
jgi:hypothetical protein